MGGVGERVRTGTVGKVTGPVRGGRAGGRAGAFMGVGRLSAAPDGDRDCGELQGLVRRRLPAQPLVHGKIGYTAVRIRGGGGRVCKRYQLAAAKCRVPGCGRENDAAVSKETAAVDTAPRPPPPVQLVPLRKLTLEELARHDGTDPSLPLFLAIKGTVYDITAGKDFYGPDGKCPMPCAMLVLPPSVKAGLCLACDSLSMHRTWPRGAALAAGYRAACVRWVRRLQTVFIASPGCTLYLMFTSSPGVFRHITHKHPCCCAGIYPFAGKEVARAFALFSTDLADCNDNLEGLSYTEKESLREWIEKFNSKYPVVGRVVQAKEPEQPQQEQPQQEHQQPEQPQQPTSEADEEEKKVQ